MIMPKLRGVARAVYLGDGAIDVVYDSDLWLPNR